MRIDHLAIWVKDLEVSKDFYVSYFQGKAGEKYHNPKKNFTSYFIYFEEGCRLELMHKPEINDNMNPFASEYFGITHFAVSAGSKSAVDLLTERLRQDNFQIVGEPRVTGDGFYESVVLDPEGNRVEITN